MISVTWTYVPGAITMSSPAWRPGGIASPWRYWSGWPCALQTAAPAAAIRNGLPR